ncbi:MAG: hypothetical protein DBX59_06245 [Bacillota bacterium]|nr:MAG: hypothetical protein DBX59_06245 [Bacillota bacterium]
MEKPLETLYHALMENRKIILGSCKSYEQALRLEEEYDEKICEFLEGNLQMKDIYEKEKDAVYAVFSEEVKDAFSEGFRYGLMLAFEVSGVFAHEKE